MDVELAPRSESLSALQLNDYTPGPSDSDARHDADAADAPRSQTNQEQADVPVTATGEESMRALEVALY